MALTAGGPGAIFWMWLIAVLNMPTAIVESTLAQLYQKRIDGQLRGGPAYYIRDGLKKSGSVYYFHHAYLLLWHEFYCRSIKYNCECTTGAV